MNTNHLAIIVPCYNEKEVITETAAFLSRILDQLLSEGKIGKGSVLCVDDGSKDGTWQIIENLSANNPYIKGLKLSRNVGHQNALWAGLEWAAENCDVAVSIDADLQDDPYAILQMIDLFNQGKEVVYGVRSVRKSDTFFKRNTALFFYKLMTGMGVDIVYNHADYRLLSKRALEAFVSYPERNLFLRGMATQIGFQSAEVFYERSERFAGESKYPFVKMLNFALDGITSFSIRPLRLIVFAGGIFILIAIAVVIYGLTAYYEGRAIPGWTSLLVSLWFIGGSILMAIGIIGEYIGKIYKEVKRRPRYFIDKEI
ncbi:glycosyltransferase family 2 protein [Flavobacterium silvaticum]|uniref:Glycosyltransferase family 2 protein n=1 Tax=Flavobacterium silvaticum TaxID=1852020 RepID=A0A972FL68_9FLAO|nr:glycosyltransferase family 2 protein [Flavobacterium silvaticum]NMH28021.1 glycosyltransferase family 2 protein [Flavobacterium silvaticum]